MASSEMESLKQEVLGALEHLHTIREQSLNLFDRPEVSDRVIQLTEGIEEKVHALNAYFKEPSTDQNKHFQDLFFHIKEMRERIVENLKLDTQKLEFQQAFIEAIEAMKHDMHLIA